MSSAAGQQVDVTDLDVPQLVEVRRQLEEELQHLTSSFGQLKGAQARFKGCIESVESIKPENKGKTTLIPLTSSLYVPGKLTDLDNVIVDIGTGYYCSKSVADARKMYEGKVTFVEKNLATLQETITRKQDNLRVVGEVMSVKAMQQQQQGGAAQARGQGVTAA